MGKRSWPAGVAENTNTVLVTSGTWNGNQGTGNLTANPTGVHQQSDRHPLESNRLVCSCFNKYVATTAPAPSLPTQKSVGNEGGRRQVAA